MKKNQILFFLAVIPISFLSNCQKDAIELPEDHTIELQKKEVLKSFFVDAEDFVVSEKKGGIKGPPDKDGDNDFTTYDVYLEPGTSDSIPGEWTVSAFPGLSQASGFHVQWYNDLANGVEVLFTPSCSTIAGLTLDHGASFSGIGLEEETKFWIKDQGGKSGTKYSTDPLSFTVEGVFGSNEFYVVIDQTDIPIYELKSRNGGNNKVRQVGCLNLGMLHFVQQ